MKLFPLLLLCAASGWAADAIDAFGLHWTVPAASEWKVEDDGGVPALRMLAARGPDPQKPAPPQQFAVADKQYDSFSLHADVKVLKPSLILLFPLPGEAHFNYAPLSPDTGA